MCGICGVLDVRGAPVARWIGRRMLDALRHRGPDDEGAAWRDGPVALFLGQRRLSIIDLSEAGRQPLFNEDGTVAIIFNGEIYNFQQLRADLVGRGHAFRSRTDTEVVVHLYEERGPEALASLDGMFALALWDERRRRLLLARDRPGKKPLYYCQAGGTFVFGSEMKAILQHPDVDARRNPRALPLYLTYGYVPSPETFYAGIRQVPAGSYLLVTPERVAGPTAYWSLRFPPRGAERRLTHNEAVDNVRALLTGAVRKRLVADVPLGAFLSGGVDSSIVVGLMARLSGRPVKTFTIGFDGTDSYDERAYARLVARRFGTEHTEFVVRPDAIALLDELVDHHDQPFGDSSAIPTYLVAKLTREHVTVALNGDGGDELFAGYERFLAACLAELVPPSLARLGALVAGRLPGSPRYASLAGRAERFFRQAARRLEPRYRGWMSFFDSATIARFSLNGAGMLPDEEIGRSCAECFARTERCDLLNRLLYVNFATYLHDDLLVKMDRMTMAHGLEARSPFLDTALIEFAAALPPRLKLRGLRLKYILKRAFADLVPAPILRRRKHGFGVPLGTWFARDLRDFVHDALLGADAGVRDVLDQSAVRALYAEHLSGRRDLGHQLWTLLTLELWLRRERTRRRPAPRGALGGVAGVVVPP